MASRPTPGSSSPSLSKVDGVEDYFSGVSEPSAELDMTVHQAEANRIGLTPVQVADQVSGALLGQQAGEIRLDDRIDRRACASSRLGSVRSSSAWRNPGVLRADQSDGATRVAGVVPADRDARRTPARESAADDFRAR